MGFDASQPPVQGQRTLAAIAFTDVVNFSGRVSCDEEHTLQLVQRDMELMRGVCQQFEGRVLKNTGDGLLMYFTSAVQAVACAQEIQRMIALAAQDLPADAVLQHRIGIHLGDVFVSQTDVMGDGVNIAARLQAEAEPGGICLSQVVYDVVKRRLALKATYLGPRELKHIQEEVPVYQIILAAQSEVRGLPSSISNSVSNHGGDRASALLSIPALILPSELNQSLETLIASYIGPIAPMLLKQTLKKSATFQQLVDQLTAQIPASRQERFHAEVERLLQSFSSRQDEVELEPMPLDHSLAPIPSLDPGFIQQCERHLVQHIGPIGSFLIQRTVAKHPTLTPNQLVDALMVHLPPQSADAFRQALLTTP